MYIDIIWKIALPIVIAPFAIAPFVMNSSTHSKGVTHSGSAPITQQWSQHNRVGPDWNPTTLASRTAGCE